MGAERAGSVGRLWRIVAPHFVSGLVVQQGQVVEAAPILEWTRGRPWPEIKRECRRRGWHGEPLGFAGDVPCADCSGSGERWLDTPPGAPRDSILCKTCDGVGRIVPRSYVSRLIAACADDAGSTPAA